mmetsp:Transcript_27990/g.66489  ORF Transcript_27990/g.66489 Transcript_27990/m.66489 type:complete len:91 (+) Transcript_27990:17-289(+)
MQQRAGSGGEGSGEQALKDGGRGRRREDGIGSTQTKPAITRCRDAGPILRRGHPKEEMEGGEERWRIQERVQARSGADTAVQRDGALDTM